jgi:hypothetical protein
MGYRGDKREETYSYDSLGSQLSWLLPKAARPVGERESQRNDSQSIA